MSKPPIWILLLVLLSPGVAASEKRGLDRVWSYATLYENDDGRGVQKLALSGRLQLDGAWFDADEGEFNDTLWRRFRFGFKTTFLRDWVLHVESDWDLNDSLNDAYNRLTDAYVGWSVNERWKLKFLKHSAGFTLDGATSSKRLLTLQRNNLTNNLWFTAEYFTGVSASGSVGESWKLNGGIFSSDGDDELSGFDAGYFVLLSAGHDFAGRLELEKAVVRVDYVRNDEDVEANTRDFSDVLTVATQWERNDWGLWTDLSGGRGYLGQSDLWGLAIMPFWNTTEHTQVVLRYTFVTSDEDNGVRLGRYENRVVEGRGDEYHELYAGFNIFFYGHKLKWQTGLQSTSVDDAAGDGGEYDGWGLTSGLRVSW